MLFFEFFTLHVSIFGKILFDTNVSFMEKQM